MKNPILTYCTNVHPLQNYAVWRDRIRYFGPNVGRAVGLNPLPLGLWFNQAVLGEIPGGLDGLENLKADLDLWGVSACTLNAFPQGNFHEAVVKRKVYLPDWTDPARLEYTKRCAETLSGLLPEGRDFGSVSTLPLGWREGWTHAHSEKAAEALVELAKFLAELRGRTGKKIALAIEPEPGCALERTPQVIDFWESVLRPVASCDGLAAVEEHIGLCYDTCHQAVQFEDAEESLAALGDAGIAIHKMQLSSALEFPADAGGKTRAARAQFVEPKFLHQTRVKAPEGVRDFDDLPDALAAGDTLFAHPWRVHYHVPVHADALLDGAIRTTRGEMLRALGYALEHDLCPHYEVETYTWSVLPEAHRPATDEALVRSLAQELNFIRAQAPGFFDT